MLLRECCCQFLPFRSVRIHMRWLHALLLTERHLLSLTMSFLCCFSLRDYGSKRKSGKSPVFLHYPSLKQTSPSFLFQLVAFNRPTPYDPGVDICCMAYDSITLSVTCLLSMWCQCLVCLLVLLCDADLLSIVFWGGFEKLSSPLLLAAELLHSPGWGFRSH